MLQKKSEVAATFFLLPRCYVWNLITFSLWCVCAFVRNLNCFLLQNVFLIQSNTNVRRSPLMGYIVSQRGCCCDIWLQILWAREGAAVISGYKYCEPERALLWYLATDIVNQRGRCWYRRSTRKIFGFGSCFWNNSDQNLMVDSDYWIRIENTSVAIELFYLLIKITKK